MRAPHAELVSSCPPNYSACGALCGIICATNEEEAAGVLNEVTVSRVRR